MKISDYMLVKVGIYVVKRMRHVMMTSNLLPLLGDFMSVSSPDLSTQTGFVERRTSGRLLVAFSPSVLRRCGSLSEFIGLG